MNNFPRTTLPAALFFGGLAFYGALVAMSGTDPAVPRGPAIDATALFTAWVMVLAVGIGVFRFVQDVLTSEPDLPWNVPMKTQRAEEPRKAA